MRCLLSTQYAFSFSSPEELGDCDTMFLFFDGDPTYFNQIMIENMKLLVPNIPEDCYSKIRCIF